MGERVAVTGMGVVSGVGVGVRVFWDSLVAGKSGVSTLTAFVDCDHPFGADDCEQYLAIFKRF